MKNSKIMFTDMEKRELIRQLKAAAESGGRVRRGTPVSRRRRLLCAAGALATLMVGAGATGLLGTPLFDKTEATLSIDDREMPLEARMKLNPDGTSTILVSGGLETTEITAPEATTKAMLSGETNCGFRVSRPEGGAYEFEEQDGRIWLFINERIPLDVTDLLLEGYTFTYTDENGVLHTASVSGAPDNYEVHEVK